MGSDPCVLEDCDLCSVPAVEGATFNSHEITSKEHQKNSSQSPSLVEPGSIT